MKLRRIFIISLLICSISAAAATNRRLLRQRRPTKPGIGNITSQNNTVEFDLNYNFSIPGETFRISFIVVIPKTLLGRQKILDIKYSPRPSRIFNQNGTRYAEFVFIRPEKRAKVKITVKAELLRYDLLTAKEKSGKGDYESSGFEEFLKHEKYIEKDDSRIQQIVQDIEGQTDLEIVKNIYAYVIDNLKYTTHGGKDWGALKALSQKKGDCSEYSDLLVAMCRAKNIPARVITGYTVRRDTDMSKHHWVEVYLRKYGWVPCDPSSGDVWNNAFRKMAFDRMRPVYIYLSHIRNDKVLKNYHFARYSYWGDRARMKDSIEFK